MREGTQRGSLRPREAAAWLGVGLTTLYGMIGRGEVRSVKIGAATLIPLASLQALLEG